LQIEAPTIASAERGSGQNGNGQRGSGHARAMNHRGPGPATMMRDAVATEVRKTHEASAFGRLLDNTWVLIGCLTVLIGGVWLAQSGGRELPVEQDDAISVSTSDVDRFQRMARSLSRSGDFARAERLLAALDAVLNDDPVRGEEARSVSLQLRELRDRRVPHDGAEPLLADSLQRVESLARAGDLPAARSLLDQLAVLYEFDSNAEPLLRDMRQTLAEETAAGQ
jgi:hypothetical protein